MQDDRIALGLDLLRSLEHAELSVADAVDRLETVSTHPKVTREILDTAEKRGIIEREDGIIRPKSSEFVSYESQVVQKDGEFECQRCGAGLSTGHFIEYDSGELGPFGSSCIRKVTVRD